jgi:hypothetical protein
MTSVPVAKLVGAGFKPALVPQARCERIAVISSNLMDLTQLQFFRTLAITRPA